MRILGIGLLALATSVPAVPQVAHARRGDKPQVLVIPLQRGPNVSGLIQPKIDEYFRTILAMNRKLKLVTIDGLKTKKVKKVRKAVSKDPTIAKADKALWKGQELLDKKKYMDAQKAFTKAKKLYQKKFAELVDFDKYIEALLGRSKAYFLAEYEDNGEDALAEVMSLRPNTVLDKRKVPKPMIIALKRLQMLYSRPEKGKVMVSSPAKGAEVYLDGVLQGTAPVTINGLFRGIHYIRVVADGHKPWSKKVTAKLTNQMVVARLKADAKAAPPAELPQKPTSLIGVAKAGKFDKGFRDYAGTLAKRHELAAILMTYIRKNTDHYDVAAFLYSPSQGHVAELEWVKIDKQLSTMQASLLQLEERILQALAVFPRTRIVDTKSRIYKPVEQKVAAVKPAPSPVGKPRPNPRPTMRPAPNPRPVARPAPYRPKPKAPPVVVAPAPKPRPAPVRPGTKPVPGPVAPAPAPVPPTAYPAPPVPPAPYPAPPAVGGTKPVPAPVRPTIRPAPAPVAAPTGPTPAPALGNGGKKTSLSIGDPKNPWEKPDDGDEEAWYEKWWVWTIVGVAVVGGATAAGVALGTGGSDAAPGFRADVRW